MAPSPLYTAHNLDPAYHLRYVWTGWPSEQPSPKAPGEQLWSELAQAWEADGLRLLEYRWTGDKAQVLFSTTPRVAPVFLAARAKGRLQHALRLSGLPCDFSRKVAVRSVGDNRIADVESYIQAQADKEGCADPRFREMLRGITVENSAVDLSAPSETHSGRYWYNIHVVLVVERRHRIVDVGQLTAVRDRALCTAREQRCGVSVLSMVPDHLHMALRGDVEQSPEEIVLAFQNATAGAVGMAVWSHGYYAGTFGSYSMDAIRRNRVAL